MLYSKKTKLDRRNSLLAAVKKELKAENAYIAPEQLKAIAQAINTAVFYNIIVVRDVEKAAETLRLTDYEMRHSWAGSKGTKEEAVKKVFGEIEFGTEYSYEYFDNGNSAGPEEHTTDGEFDVNQSFAFLRHTRDWNNWQGDCCNCNDEWDSIVIYAPESIIDEKAYVAAKNAELDELCKLR